MTAESEQSKLEPYRLKSHTEAIKFMQIRLDKPFDKESANTLFAFYALDEDSWCLQSSQMRELLFDLLAAHNWPLVVPGEALCQCLDGGRMLHNEFVYFFVSLHKKPLSKLFETVTKSIGCSEQHLSQSRLVTIKPTAANMNIILGPAAANDREVPFHYGHLAKWWHALRRLNPDAKQIFLHHDGKDFETCRRISALVVGVESKSTETKVTEVELNGVLFLFTTRAFDKRNDTFPPVVRGHMEDANDRVGLKSTSMAALVSGFVREMQRNLSIQIVEDVEGLIFHFWFIDRWDESWLDPVISMDGQSVQLTEKECRSMYGMKSVEKGSFEWQIRFRTRIVWIFIGVIKDDLKSLQSNRQSFLYAMDLPGGGCGDVEGGGGCLLGTNGALWHKMMDNHDYCDPFKEEGTLVTMRLNLDDKTITYGINGKFGESVVFDFPGDRYRLVVTMTNRGDKIELL